MQVVGFDCAGIERLSVPQPNYCLLRVGRTVHFSPKIPSYYGLFYVHQTPSYNGAFLCTKDPLLLWDLFMYSSPLLLWDLFMYSVPFIMEPFYVQLLSLN